MKNSFKIIKCVVLKILLTLLIIGTLSLLWISENYGNINLDEIVFTLNMPLAGASKSFINSYIIFVIVPTIIIMTINLKITLHNKKQLSVNNNLSIIFPKYYTDRYLYITWFLLFLCIVDIKFEVKTYIQNQIYKSEFIENEYINPEDVLIIFQKQKEI